MTKLVGVFCDDIRREESGKFILIGVYTGALRVDRFPRRARIQAFVQLELDAEPVQHRINLRLSHDGIELVSALIEASPTLLGDQRTRETHPIAMPKVTFEVRSDSELLLEASVDGGEYFRVADLFVNDTGAGAGVVRKSADETGPEGSSQPITPS